MRVIAGKSRRISLTAPAGLETRPTSDRLKETLFNVIQDYIVDSCFLDLFSGSGGIAIEAVSRGAKEAVLVENSKQALEAIRINLAKTHLEDACRVLAMDYLAALKMLQAEKGKFSVVFMDPPYDRDYEKKVLEYLSGSSLLEENALLVFEASLKTEFDYIDSFGYELYKVKKYKTNQHVFLKWKGNS